jgi:hypothetical protein
MPDINKALLARSGRLDTSIYPGCLLACCDGEAAIYTAA